MNLIDKKEIEAICKNNRSTEYKKISAYLAMIEHFCVGLNTGIYDYETFYQLAVDYLATERGTARSRIEIFLMSKGILQKTVTVT